MSLIRVWIPSGNYSGGSTKRLIVIHTMEGFTGANGAYDCAKYFQGNVGSSSQVCIDNNRGKIWECVKPANGAWTQCNFNSVSVSAEQSGYASWSRDYWLNNRANELRNTADWIAEEAARYGIPIRALTSGEAQSGGKGICQHVNLGSSGCGHSDCGSGYPIDKVIEWAKGTPETTGGAFMSSSVTYKGSTPVYACVWDDGKINVKFGDNGTWQACDPSQSPVRSGVDITNTPGGGLLAVFTNSSGDVCGYYQGPDGGEWSWRNLAGNAK